MDYDSHERNILYLSFLCKQTMDVESMESAWAGDSSDETCLEMELFYENNSQDPVHEDEETTDDNTTMGSDE